MMRFDIITIFPQMFDSPFRESLISKARDKGLLEIRVHDLRDHTLNKHKKVDDAPFGGGVGMIMNVEPIVRAIEAVKKDRPSARTVLMSPSGRRFDQEKARELSQAGDLIFVCGRYEGIDERVGLHFVDEELSIGDYVLSGGEIPAMVVIEAVSRLVPGVVGDEHCLEEESFTDHCLEYPQYTRPREFMGHEVPEVLISGDPKKIRRWQWEQALKKTASVRPDLLKKLKLSDQDKVILERL
ncbi:MAG: tRNA (guanosine(37)-N1)-methyltransferase TrmD, partial [Nitrospinales bacterium]